MIRQIGIPTNCEYCGQPLEFDGVHLVCKNDECSGKKLYKFIDAFNILEIKGAGEKMIEDLFEHVFCHLSIFDILDPKVLKPGYLSGEGVKVTKNVEKVIDKLKSLKSLTLEQVIMMLGYTGVGKSSSVQIARFVSGLDYDFSGFDRTVVSGWEQGSEKCEKLEKTLEKISSFGIDIIYPKEENTSGLTLELTGSPKPFFSTKDEFLKAISSFGYVHAGIKDAKILVTDDYSSTSSKMKTAKKKGLEVITYEDLGKKLGVLGQ